MFELLNLFLIKSLIRIISAYDFLFILNNNDLIDIVKYHSRYCYYIRNENSWIMKGKSIYMWILTKYHYFLINN